MKKFSALTLAFFLYFATSAHAVDFWQKLKDVFQKKAQEHEESLDPKLKPAVRAIVGYSEAEEVAIGRQAAGNLLGAAPLVSDFRLQQYVNKVGRWIASQSDRPSLSWHFGVIDSNDINAFAAPGGYVFITKGLYGRLGDESELAGVLAHEISHIVHKHHLNILSQSQITEVGKRLLLEQTGENETIKRLLGEGAEIFARSLDKKAEYEADRDAVVLAARAGYDPFGLPAVLQNIGEVAKDDHRIRLLFKTHPAPDDRIAELDRAIATRFDAIHGRTLEKRFYHLAQMKTLSSK